MDACAAHFSTFSTLDQSLRSLPQQFQASPRQCDDFSFTILGLLVITLDVLVGDCFDHLNDVLGLCNHPNQLPIIGLEQLEQSPNSDVLKGRIATGQEASEVAMNTAVRFRPVLYKDGVVADCDML